jgi:hypothetical protein
MNSVMDTGTQRLSSSLVPQQSEVELGKKRCRITELGEDPQENQAAAAYPTDPPARPSRGFPVAFVS